MSTCPIQRSVHLSHNTAQNNMACQSITRHADNKRRNNAAMSNRPTQILSGKKTITIQNTYIHNTNIIQTSTMTKSIKSKYIHNTRLHEKMRANENTIQTEKMRETKTRNLLKACQTLHIMTTHTIHTKTIREPYKHLQTQINALCQRVVDFDYYVDSCINLFVSYLN